MQNLRLIKSVSITLLFMQLALTGFAATAPSFKYDDSAWLKNQKEKRNYIYILVHGITADFYGTYNKDKNDRDQTYLQYFEQTLGLKGHVFGYTFLDPVGNTEDNFQQLYNRNYFKQIYNKTKKINGYEVEYKTVTNADLKKKEVEGARVIEGNKYFMSKWQGNINPEAFSGIEAKAEGNSWFDQARSDFRQNLFNEDQKKEVKKWSSIDQIPASLIPNKFVIIAHSMGNLAVLRYLTSDAYGDNVVKYISMDGVLHGTEGYDLKQSNMSWQSLMNDGFSGLLEDSRIRGSLPNLKPLYDFKENARHIASLISMGLVGWEIFTGSGLPSIDDILVWSTVFGDNLGNANGFAGQSVRAVASMLLTDAAGGSYDFQGVKDMNPKGAVINTLKVAGGPTNIKLRLASSLGMPTHQTDVAQRFEMARFFPKEHMQMISTTKEFRSLPTLEMKLLSLLLTYLEPDGAFVQNGSLAVPQYSSEGKDIKLVDESKDKMFYQYNYYDKDMNNTLEQMPAALLATHTLYGITGQRLVYFIPTLMLSGQLARILSDTDKLKSRLLAHSSIIIDSTKQDEQSDIGPGNTQIPLIEMMLYDQPQVRGKNLLQKLNKSNLIATFMDGAKQAGDAIGSVGEISAKFGSISASLGNLGSLDIGKFDWSGIDIGKVDFNLALNNINWETFKDMGEAQAKTYLQDQIKANIATQLAVNLPPADANTDPLTTQGFKAYVPADGNIEMYGNMPTLDAQAEAPGAVAQQNGVASVAFDYLGVEEKTRLKAINVKCDKIIFNGVLDDFNPTNMYQFEYSLNFGAWQDIRNLPNRDGSFQLGPLELAEGQNLLAFRSINKVGYYSNQVLKFIKSSTPLLPSNMTPEPENVVGGSTNRVTVACDFNDAQFDTKANASKIIEPLEFKIYKERSTTVSPSATEMSDRELVFSTLADVVQTVTQTTYKYTLNLKTPPLNLSEGKYDVQVVAKDTYGHQSQTFWSFFVDRTAPSIIIEPVAVFSPKPASENTALKIRYTLADNQSTFLKDITYTVKDSNNSIITTLPSSNSLSTGEHYIEWSGLLNNGTVVPDGFYSIEITAFDQAGNKQTKVTSIEIDSTPPSIKTAAFDHNPMTSKYDSLSFTVEATETANAILKIAGESNSANNSARFFPLSIVYDPYTKTHTGKFTMSYSGALNSSLPDGTYNWTLEATDMAGNTRTVNSGWRIADGEINQGNQANLGNQGSDNLIIDRTPPTIYESGANPMTLSPASDVPFTTTIVYKIKDESECTASVVITNQSTGEAVANYNPAPANTNVINQENQTNQANQGSNSVLFNANGLPKGSYRATITVSDKYGNNTHAYADMVKEGIAPIIAYPQENGTIVGNIAVKGTVQDPDWQNSYAFEKYSVFLAKGHQDLPTDLKNLSSIWSKDNLATPLVNRSAIGGKPSEGFRPVQDYSDIVYLLVDPENSEPLDGEYTLLLVASEQTLGATAGVVRHINISVYDTNNPKPAIQLANIEGSDLKRNQYPAITGQLIVSGKTSAVDLDVVDSKGKVVYHHNYAKVETSPFFGKPDIPYGKQAGIYFWQDTDGAYYTVFNGDSQPHNFTGNFMGKMVNNSGDVGTNSIIDVKLQPNGYKLVGFRVSEGPLIVFPKMDQPDTALPDPTNMFMGLSGQHPDFLPLLIQETKGTTALGSRYFSWDKKDARGVLVPDGRYKLIATATGHDGEGYARVEETVTVSSRVAIDPASIVLSPANRVFSPLDKINKLAISFTLNKPCYITAEISEELDDGSEGESVGYACKDKYFPGGPNMVIEWTGEYPYPGSGQFKSSGRYMFKLIPRELDSVPEKGL